MSGLSRYGTAGDARGFYTALGVSLAPRAEREAAVACFADPDAHRRGDRDPSCSVNLASGAWQCHACGANGGAYDAALLFGRTSRQAIDLMVFHGLTERRTSRLHRREGPGPRVTRSINRPHCVPQLEISDGQLQGWGARLQGDERLLGDLMRRRAWTADVLARYEVGWDGRRIVFPVRCLAGDLIGVLRYAPPWRRHGPKLLALPGSRRGLFPSLAVIASPAIWITEGQPDALAAHAAGLPAVAIPGVWGWEHGWAVQLKGRDVVICADADAEGRRSAQRISSSLVPVARTVRVLDLDPERDDGYDLTDAIIGRGLRCAGKELLARAAAIQPVATSSG